MILVPRILFAAALTCGSAAAGVLYAAEATPEQLEFFEKQVRPVLVERCQKCHGAEKQESGLRLDRREAALKGSDSGRMIVPGEPDKSPLIEAVRYQGDTQMPPAGKLPEVELTALVKWVQMGAPWPADQSGSGEPKTGAPAPSQNLAAKHWAFQPVTRRALPDVKQTDWCENPVDRFVLHELEAKGLSPSAKADRRTLLRRVTFDLIGLPPTPEEVEAFEHDASPDAWARAIDRLLASPHYGERWARHWLDVARYADTKGYVFTQERRYPFSYTYRDYVIRAMNGDLPYDRFVCEQIAADQLPLGDDNRALAALGFLTLGRRFMFNVHDIIDDRIDVVSRGLLGLTVTCARCHDHKFDPIPSADYYSLYGVFASSKEPDDEPLIGVPEETAEYAQFKQQRAELQKAVEDYRTQKHAELEKLFRSQAGDYLAQLIRERPGEPPYEEPMLSIAPGDLRPPMVDRWRQFLKQTAASRHAVFLAWHELAAIPPAEFSQKSGEVFDRWSSAAETGQPINALVRQRLIERRPATMMDVARLYGELFTEADKAWNEARQATPPGERLADSAQEELRQVLYGANSPVVLSEELAQRLVDREVRDQLTALQRKVDELEATSPAAPARAMAMVDAPQPVEPHVFIRGNPGRPGERVPRQFLAVLSRGQREPFKQGSGRLELAQAIASRDNPLTARVLVNRVWMHHFGSSLVRTPSDFGVRTNPPSHPGLLDWLAASLMDDGWSLKRLHRMILLSSTYQQASIERPDCAAVDPENRLLYRMNRRRLDFESMRDSYLAVADRLDRGLGGRPVDIWAQPFSGRRSVYAYIDRQDLPGVFRVFDFANPDVSIDQRPRTTVPQQALFAMNSPFVLDEVRKLMARPEIAAEADTARRVQALYRLIFERAASDDEVELARRFVTAPPISSEASKLSPWELYDQALLSANEFMFVD
ncbi:MAG TPA: PSD1 and planctomycete cytochrome C domain-containing protein [Pirellulales bacterium]|nr:PSD1 and planctomycete cytochrome C domain-containing protein [Pirellulales bacterium]